MASKKQLVPSEILAIQSLPPVDSGFVGFGAKEDGLYMKFSDGSEFKLLSLKDGNVILSGTTIPSNSLGRAGDYYINNIDWTIYGPKAEVWGSPTNLRGEDGDDGINGNMWYTGAAVPSNSAYNDGDFFLQGNGLLYQKISGTWSYITNLKGSNGNDGIGTAESVGALINSLTTKSTPTDSDLWTLRDEVSGLWRKINTTQLLAFLETNFDLKYEPINSVVVNYYVTNLTELISAWTDAQTKILPAKIYANGVMNLTANVTLGGTREIPIEGIPSVRFNLNGYELDIYRPHLTSVVFFSPNANGYLKARNAYATLNRVFFGQDNYKLGAAVNQPNIPHILVVGSYTNNTGGININGLTHQTNFSNINENPNAIIQPIWIKDTSGQSGQRMFIDIKGVSAGRSFDRFSKVLVTADNPNLIVLVGGDTTWFYDDIQPQPGSGLNPLSTLKPITSVHELRLNDFEEIEDVADEDRVLIQQGNKVVLAPKTSVGGGPETSIIESDTAPLNPTNGTRWLDTTSGIKYEYTINNWVELGPQGSTSGSVFSHGNLTNKNGEAEFQHITQAQKDDLDTITQAYWASVAEAIHSYGIIIDDNLSSPDRVQRIGNMEMHRTLPLHQWKNGLFDAAGNVNYYCHPQNTALKDDGVTAAVLDGTDGDVMSERMGFYVKFREVGDKQTEFRCSGVQIPGYSWIPRGLLGVYEASLNRLTGQMRSVMNFTPTYRGGNNNAAFDASGNTFLGRAVSQQNLTQFRTASRIGRNNQWSPISYFERWIRTYMYWVEYANTNSQAAVVGRNPVTGFMEGGLGNGVTTANNTEWVNFNGAHPFVPIGITNAIGNGSGEVSYVATNFGGAGQNRTFTPNRYRGVENPFGHIWEWHDGILVDVKTNADGDTSTMFRCDDPTKFASTVTSDYTNRGLLPRTEGYIRHMKFGEIMPEIVTGAGSTTFYCDNYWRNIISTVVRGVLFGGAAHDGSFAGLVLAFANYTPSDAGTTVGSRLCFLDA